MAAAEGNQYALGNDGGAPTKYKKEFADQAYRLCLLGFTDKQLGEFFEVDEVTIRNWKKQYEEFFAAVQKGKDIADANVAESFYRRATGYNYDERTYERVEGIQSQESPLIKSDAYCKKIVTKHLPPDAGAALNWLKNRQGQKWRDKQTIEFESLDEDSLEEIIDRLKGEAKNGT